MTRKHSIFLPLTVLALVVALSFGQSTGFALWQDDNALIFKLQHLEEQAGVFGAGPLGLGAYRYIAVPYIPLYKLFGMNIPIFYAWAVLFYFLASVTVFLLARQITKDNLLSILSGSIFAAGFIGSDGILRLFNSVQTSYSIIFVCLTFIFLHRFVQSQHHKYYLLALLFFFIALETAFIRTQYLIFPLIIFGLLFLAKKKLLLLFPFLAIYFFIFSKNPDPRTQLLGEFINGILDGQLQSLHGFLGTLGNIIIPTPINDFLFNVIGKISLDYGNRLLLLELFFLGSSIFLINFFLKKTGFFRLLFPFILIAWFLVHIVFFHDQELILRHSPDVDIPGVFANFVGGLFLIIAGVFVFCVRNVKARLLLIFTLSWMLFNILAYSIYLPFSPLESIHRYLVHSLAAYAVFVLLSIYYLWGRRVSFIVVSFIVLLNVVSSMNYQQDFIATKSFPTNKFYKDLKEFVSEIPKGAVLYFDVAQDEVSQQQVRDFFSVASMPDTTAIAIRYGIDRYDFKMTTSFDELPSLLDDKSTDFVFSFFYDKNGLKDTTSITRANLEHGAIVNLKSLDPDAWDILTTTPMMLEFSARVTPSISISSSCTKSVQLGQDKLLLDYILSRDEFLKNVKIKTSSQEKYLTSKFLTDGDTDTLWRGGRGWWHENEKEEIVLDMGEIKNIGQLVWVNGYANSTPTDYKIEISVDGENWYEVVKVVDGGKLDNGMLVIEGFNPRPARFIKMTINSTFDNDAPAIGDIEVVESPFTIIDKSKIKTFEAEISCVQDKNELEILSEFIKKKGIGVNIVWETEKRFDNVLSFLAKSDGLYHRYSLFLPAGGIKMKNLRIEPAMFPAKIDITDMLIIYPNIAQLRRLEEAEFKR